MQRILLELISPRKGEVEEVAPRLEEVRPRLRRSQSRVAAETGNTQLGLGQKGECLWEPRMTARSVREVGSGWAVVAGC